MAFAFEALRARFPSLGFEEAADGVLELVIANEGRQNSATEAMHRDLANVWRALDAEPGVGLDYLALVETTGLTEVPDGTTGPALLAVAARVGTTRLIDNATVDLGSR